MKLIVGLGNPGKQYEKTRHNAGFIIVDHLKELLNFPEFKMEKKFAAEISQAKIGNEKIILVKPQTFMNLSGQSISGLMDFYKLSEENLVIIHDDLDIELGAYKISADSSAGGHNGIISIIERLGTQRFKRIRIGIEGAEKKKERVMSGSDFVMQNFSEKEMEIIKNLVGNLSREI